MTDEQKKKQQQVCMNQGGVGRDQRNAKDDDGALVAFAKNKLSEYQTHNKFLCRATLTLGRVLTPISNRWSALTNARKGFCSTINMLLRTGG